MADRAATTPFTSGKKLLLADHRYGREEMLSLYQENPILPSRIAWIPDLVRTEALQPLALLPLTEQEQVSLLVRHASNIRHAGFACDPKY